jgi:hypothetical protein
VCVCVCMCLCLRCVGVAYQLLRLVTDPLASLERLLRSYSCQSILPNCAVSSECRGCVVLLPLRSCLVSWHLQPKISTCKPLGIFAAPQPPTRLSGATWRATTDSLFIRSGLVAPHNTQSLRTGVGLSGACPQNPDSGEVSDVVARGSTGLPLMTEELEEGFAFESIYDPTTGQVVQVKVPTSVFRSPPGSPSKKDKAPRRKKGRRDAAEEALVEEWEAEDEVEEEDDKWQRRGKSRKGRGRPRLTGLPQAVPADQLTDDYVCGTALGEWAQGIVPWELLKRVFVTTL